MFLLTNASRSSSLMSRSLLERSTPALCDVRITSVAICALISRMRSIRGYRSPIARSSSVTASASPRDAASTIESVTLEALARMAPSPRPGNIYILLPWPGYSVVSPYSIDGNGDPEAKSTRPSVFSTASWKEHSESFEGLESGKMMGRGLSAAIAWMTAGLNAP